MINTLLGFWAIGFVFCAIVGFVHIFEPIRLEGEDESFGAKLILTGIFFPIALPVWMVYGFVWLWKMAFSEPEQRKLWKNK